MSAQVRAPGRPGPDALLMAGSAVSTVLPLPLPSSIVDPRVGDLGPALLALADGTIFPGIAFGAALAAGGDLVVLSLIHI